MAALSGKDGTVSLGSSIDDATGWSISSTSNNPSYASSSTSGVKQRVAGVKDCTGSFSAKGTCGVSAGSTAALSLTYDGTTTISLNVIVDAVNVEVDMDDGDVVGYTVDWSGNGAVTGI